MGFFDDARSLVGNAGEDINALLDSLEDGASGAAVFGSDGSAGDVWTAHMLAYKQ